MYCFDEYSLTLAGVISNFRVRLSFKYVMRVALWDYLRKRDFLLLEKRMYTYTYYSTTSKIS